MTPPVLVTGLPRSGTSWVGKMLAASGRLVYVNEPLNPQRPPGRSPGVLNATVTHRFQYICRDNEREWLAAFTDTIALRYRFRAELRRNRSLPDLARMAKYGTAFTAGRLLRRRALLDDPFALLSAGWFAERLGCRVIVLRRDPVALAASWRRLGWTFDFRELHGQPYLLRDHPEAARTPPPGPLAAVATLWRVAAAITARLAERHPAILVVRYDDLAADPIPGFRRLYDWAGLSWTPRAERRIRRGCTASATSRAAFTWTGLSRTAYRPMNSRRALAVPSGLTAEEISLVRALTASP